MLHSRIEFPTLLSTMNTATYTGWFWFALLLFFVCTVVFLYPYSFYASNTVSDAGDPLLNISTLWRVQQHLAKGEILDLYEAAYFYPRENVLAYSEIMLPTAIISWPVAAISGNPVLSYNFAFFLAYFLTALFTFLLVKRLTGSPVAGIVSGLLFAFCQWRIHRPAHLQLLTNQWTPLVFLFLHRFWEGRRRRDIVLAAVFFAVQTLSCIYLGLIFSVGVGIALAMIYLSHYQEDRMAARAGSPDLTLKRRLMQAVRPALPLILFGAVALAILVGPLYPYYKLSPMLEKERWGSEGADLLGYITTTEHDWLWGGFEPLIDRGERVLFPGALAILLVLLGFALTRMLPLDLNSERSKNRMSLRRLLRVAVLVSRTCLWVIGFVILMRLLKVNVLGLELGFIPLRSTVRICLAAGALSLVLRKLTQNRFLPRVRDAEALYVAVAIAGFVLSLGPRMWFLGYSYGSGVFKWLAEIAPPFAGMRSIGRFGILALFAFSVLAGFAAERIQSYVGSKWANRMRLRASWVLVLASIASCFPLMTLPHHTVPGFASMPAEYKWLSEQPGEKLIMEIPMSGRWDTEYMYCALFHNKSLVNGYSGWAPPEYCLLQRGLQWAFPSRWIAVLADEMGVDHILVHLDKLDGAEIENMKSNIAHNGLGCFEIEGSFRPTWVLRTRNTARGAPTGALLARRELLFEHSFSRAHSADQRIFEGCRIAVDSTVTPLGRSEILVQFDQPVTLDGIFVDFHKSIRDLSGVLSVQTEDSSGRVSEQPVTNELSLYGYRRDLFGKRFRGFYEFSIPEAEARAIRLRLNLAHLGRSVPQIDVWGFSMKKQGDDPHLDEQEGDRNDG